VDSYQKGMFDKFGFLATWLPNAAIRLGDVGAMSGGKFQRVTSLGDLGITFQVRKGSQPIDLSHSSEEGVSINLSGNAAADAGPAEANAGVAVVFGSKGSFVFQATGCVEHSIEDQAKLGRDVIAKFKSGGDWDPDWVVINTVVEAKCATVLVSSSSEGKVELTAKGNLPPNGLALANADAGLHLSSLQGDVLHFVAQQGLTPMFRVSRIKRGLLARLLGKTEFEHVKSIGPQVFSDEAGNEPGAVAEGDEALENVTPE
jgi:hypothetical protein